MTLRLSNSGIPESRDLAPMHGVIETSLVKQNHMAAEVFNALMIDTAARRNIAPLKKSA